MLQVNLINSMGKIVSMNVLEYIKEKRKAKPLHFTLIDPDKQEPEKAGEIARKAKKYGSDLILVGGTSGTPTGTSLTRP